METLERQVAELKSHQEFFQKCMGDTIATVVAKMNAAIEAGKNLVSFKAFTDIEEKEQTRLLKKLETRLEFLQKISSELGPSGNIVKILNLISISLELHNLERFQALLRDIARAKEGANNYDFN